MDLEDLKLRYKALGLWVRVALIVTIGLLPALYLYFEEGDLLEQTLITVKDEETAAQTRFEKARQKKAGLPKLEETLAFTQEQLDKAKRLLPDTYQIERLLNQFASFAQSRQVQLTLFDPQVAIKHQKEDLHFEETPILTEVEGSFEKIAGFIDDIVHMETNVMLKAMVLTPSAAAFTPAPEGNTLSEQEKALKFERESEAYRKGFKEKAKLTWSIYRSLGAHEIPVGASKKEGGGGKAVDPEATKVEGG